MIPESPVRPASTATAPEDRVPPVQKFAYGLGSCHDMWGHWVYPTVALTVFNIHLGVPVAMVTMALMFNRFFDAVSDPIFGRLSDNTRTRYGRRRPYLLVGGVLSGLAMPMLFWVQPGWSNAAYITFILVSSAIFIPLMSSFNMAYQSLGMEMTPDYHERTNLFSWKTALQKLPELGNYFIPQFTTMAIWVGATHTGLVERLWGFATSSTGWARSAPGEHPNILLGAQVGFAILGAIMIAVAILQFVLLRERYYQQVSSRQQEKVPLMAAIGGAIKCRPFRLLLLMIVTFATGQSMVSTLSYYDVLYYVCRGDVSLGNTWIFYMGIGNMVLGVAGLPLFSWLARRWGKRHALGIALAFSVLMYFSTWWTYTPEHAWLLPLSWGLIGMGAAGVWMLYQSILADVMDYDEVQTGLRREGSFNACGSWLIKAGMAAGFGCSGLVLSMTGFDAKLGAAQTPGAIFMMRFLFPAVPMVALLLALFFVVKLPLTHATMLALRRQLEDRRGKV
jgi:GPH family glycoside/pentoside/hexuronide:cation symporter